MLKNKAINEEQFISEIQRWIRKGHYPLEKITFLNIEDNEKVIAILSYCDLETNLYIDRKSYKNYQNAFTKIGALFDKAEIKNNQDSYMNSIANLEV